MKNAQANKGELSRNGDVHMHNDLHELFLDELADLLDAEKQLTIALSKLEQAAEARELREAFRSHLEETEEQVNRLEEIFSSLEQKARSKTCQAMKGLIAEGTNLISELNGKKSLDAGLIAAAQKVEHYEIASYGTVLAWARQMGHTEAADLLEKTLDEEKAADEKLTGIASDKVNENAQQQ